MSLLRVIRGGIGRQSCVGVGSRRYVPSPGELRHRRRVLCVIPEGWELLWAVNVAELLLLEGRGRQGEMVWAVWSSWGKAGSAQDGAGSVPEHPGTAASSTAQGYPRRGFSSDVLASCKVILHFIASFLL